MPASRNAHKVGWKNPKHRQQWANTLATYASPAIGALAVRDVDVDPVLKVLEPIWLAKPETASRVRGRMESILDWAKVRGYRSGDNPARWKGHLDQLLPGRSKVRSVKHHAALPYAELPAFMTELRARDGIAARALEFLLLTAARTGDLVGGGRADAPPMRWEHVDLEARLWTIPKTKNGAEHRVPLSEAAVGVLATMKALAPGEGVFPSTSNANKALSNMARLALLERMGRGDLTAHGFRATFKTWASERTNFAREVVEAALAHTISDQLEAAYRRGDLFEKRRRLMAAWAEYAGSRGGEAGKVISLPAR